MLVISEHARFEMARRRISDEAVREVALLPQQVVSSQKGRRIHQSRLIDPAEEKEMLLRVVVEERRGELLVVTAYKTSKVEKYWQGSKRSRSGTEEERQ
jgi:hypothetical protein